MDLYRRGEKWQTRPSNHLFFMGTRTLVKADLGTKRACPSCGARFYDLSKRPIECPKCAFSFEPETLYKQRRGRQPEPVSGVVPAAEAEEEETEDENEETESEAEDEEEEAVEEAPLNVTATGEDEDEETAEEEEAEAESGMSVVEGDEDVAIEDIEVEDDEDEDDDELLDEVEEDEDDVAGIIDPGIAKDEG
jgi:uncharacterized protein (TIGR02300 family)